MHLRGVYMLPGLPNSTGVSQEMDHLFSSFKHECDSKAEVIFERKTYLREKAVEESKTATDIEIPVAHLTNDDIPEIVNGKAGDPLEKRPFESHFCKEVIGRSWIAIGFTPFTRQALHRKKVRHTLGEGGGQAWK